MSVDYSKAFPAMTPDEQREARNLFDWFVKMVHGALRESGTNYDGVQIVFDDDFASPLLFKVANFKNSLMVFTPEFVADFCDAGENEAFHQQLIHMFQRTTSNEH